MSNPIPDRANPVGITAFLRGSLTRVVQNDLQVGHNRAAALQYNPLIHAEVAQSQRQLRRESHGPSLAKAATQPAHLLVVGKETAVWRPLLPSGCVWQRGTP